MKKGIYTVLIASLICGVVFANSNPIINFSNTILSKSTSCYCMNYNFLQKENHNNCDTHNQIIFNIEETDVQQLISIYALPVLDAKIKDYLIADIEQVKFTNIDYTTSFGLKRFQSLDVVAYFTKPIEPIFFNGFGIKYSIN